MNKSYRDVLEILGAFAVAFIFYQALILATGSPLPIVSVVSDSMYHTSGFEKWWGSAEGFYTGHDITRQDFLSFTDFNGLSRGDLLLVVKPVNLQVGDIVIYQRDGTSITIVHRVIEISGDRIVTKGDNNAGPDQPITLGNVQGKVVFAVPVLGYPRYVLHIIGI
jgi:SOS-response transcriptional repressor LexA